MPLSDKSVTIAELKDLAQRFSRARDWDRFHDAKELAIGLVTEGAELLEHFRFKSANQIRHFVLQPQTRVTLEDELADVLFMILRLSTTLDLDLAAIFERKLKKTARHYPIKRSKGKNIKYDEL